VQERSTDVLIIGAGTAGLSARKQAERLGKSWILVESGPHGTTCARVGCMPSKLLIAAANAAHDARRGAPFGIEVSEVRVDGRAVMQRVRAERDRLVDFVLQDVEGLPADSTIDGHARFVDAQTVSVDDHTRIRFGSAVIATGASPWIPGDLEPIRDRLTTNEQIFEWETLPQSVALFGTGLIALELGQALHRLGVRVVFLNPFDDLGPFSDPVVKDKACGVLTEELQIFREVEYETIEAHGDDAGVRVVWRCADGTQHDEVFERAVAGTGRRPNLDGLDLERADVPLDEDGRPISDPTTMQLGDRPIFVAGDMAGHRPLLHEASHEGRIAGKNAAQHPDVDAVSRFVPLAIAFTSPGIAIVGQAHRDLDLDDTIIGEVSYDDQGRARIMGINQGHVRIYARREDLTLIGAEMFGPRVEHTAHLLAWAISCGLNVDQALGLPFYHPVVEEGLRTALRDLRNRSGQRPSSDA